MHFYELGKFVKIWPQLTLISEIYLIESLKFSDFFPEILKFMLGWVRTTLSSRFKFKLKKNEAPIGVPGTSIRSVPTLTGEGINTHTHTHRVMCRVVMVTLSAMIKSSSQLNVKL